MSSVSSAASALSSISLSSTRSLGGDLADQLRHFDPQAVAADAAGDRRLDPRHQRGADALLDILATAQIGGSAPSGSAGNQNELARLRLDDAAPEAGRSHVALLCHQRRRSRRPARQLGGECGDRISELAAPRRRHRPAAGGGAE